MGRAIALFIPIVAIIFMAACKGGVYGGAYVEDSHYHHEPEQHVSAENYYPWLEGFYVVDSFGFSVDSSSSSVPELDPYVDDGVFEVEWEVDAVRDYIVEYRINDIPDVVGSRLIDAELCGWGLACDTTGYQFCQYNPDFTLSCDVVTPAYVNVDSYLHPLDISDMIFSLPESLYLIMQICDTGSNYCEFDVMPTLFY